MIKVNQFVKIDGRLGKVAEKRQMRSKVEKYLVTVQFTTSEGMEIEETHLQQEMEKCICTRCGNDVTMNAYNYCQQFGLPTMCHKCQQTANVHRYDTNTEIAIGITLEQPKQKTAEEKAQIEQQRQECKQKEDAEQERKRILATAIVKTVQEDCSEKKRLSSFIQSILKYYETKGTISEKQQEALRKLISTKKEKFGLDWNLYSLGFWNLSKWTKEEKAFRLYDLYESFVKNNKINEAPDVQLVYNVVQQDLKGNRHWITSMYWDDII